MPLTKPNQYRESIEHSLQDKKLIDWTLKRNELIAIQMYTPTLVSDFLLNGACEW